MPEISLKPLKIDELTAPIPVIQGGMGVGISLSGLVGAVAAGGGIGILAAAQIGYRSPDFDRDPIQANLKALQEEIQRAREIARGGIVGVNIMAATRQYEDYVKTAVAAGADLIISGAGLPMTLPEAAGSSGTKLAPIVSSLKSVRVILRYWLKKYDRLPDLIVIEGPAAGGHLGFRYEELEHIEQLRFEEEAAAIIQYVKECAEAKGRHIPVVLAGGIYTRQDAESAAALGADGVQMATRFVTTYECDAPDAFKQAYLNAGPEDIALIKSPVGMPGRAVRNSFFRRTQEGRIPHGLCHQCISTCKPDQTPYCITDALVGAARGDAENSLVFCGLNAWRSQRLEHVEDILREFKPA